GPLGTPSLRSFVHKEDGSSSARHRNIGIFLGACPSPSAAGVYGYSAISNDRPDGQPIVGAGLWERLSGPVVNSGRNGCEVSVGIWKDRSSSLLRMKGGEPESGG